MQFENVKDCEKESRVSDGKYVKLTLSLIFSRVEGTDEDYIGQSHPRERGLAADVMINDGKEDRMGQVGKRETSQYKQIELCQNYFCVKFKRRNENN